MLPLHKTDLQINFENIFAKFMFSTHEISLCLSQKNFSVRATSQTNKDIKPIYFIEYNSEIGNLLESNIICKIDTEKNK